MRRLLRWRHGARRRTNCVIEEWGRCVAPPRPLRFEACHACRFETCPRIRHPGDCHFLIQLGGNSYSELFGITSFSRKLYFACEMNRYIVLLALSLFFVGCASSFNMKVSVSDGKEDYSIYCDGELACLTSDDCVIKSSTSEDTIYLEARKNEIIYGSLQVNRGKSTYHFSAGLLRHWPFFSDGRGRASTVMTMLILDAIMFPVAVATAVIPTKQAGKFPTEVVIPIARKNSAWGNWDKSVWD